MDVDQSSWRRDQSSWMWIDLPGAGVLVCDLGGAWMNRALTVAWRGRGRRSDRHDRGFDGAISLSVCVFVSPSLSTSFSLCASPEMVWSENNNVTLLPLFYSQHWKYFQFDPIFSNNQTPTFTEKHFRKWFEAKTNAALISHIFLHMYSLIWLWLYFLFHIKQTKQNLFFFNYT